MNNGKQRLESLDALRGFDMMFIMGGLGVVSTVGAALGHPEFGRTFNHATWHGLQFMDTVFPLFVFLAGASWPFSLASQLGKGRTQAQIFGKVAYRAFMLFALGLIFYSPNFFSFDPAKFRYMSVLCHIGISWGVAATVWLLVKSWKGRLAITLGLLLTHWAILFFTIAPDLEAVLMSDNPRIASEIDGFCRYGFDGFSVFGSTSCWLDRMLLPGAVPSWLYENDGILAKLSGIAIALFGMFAGELLRSDKFTGNGKVLRMLGCGAALLVVGAAWVAWCPVNKRLWTPTFAIFLSAYAYLMLGAFYWIIDVKGWRRWAFAFKVIGMNSITIYLVQRVVDFNVTSRFFFSGIADMLPFAWGKVVLAFGYLLSCWLLLLFLYRKKIFLKI